MDRMFDIEFDKLELLSKAAAKAQDEGGPGSRPISVVLGERVRRSRERGGSERVVLCVCVI